jgi:hypothetical protein
MSGSANQSLPASEMENFQLLCNLLAPVIRDEIRKAFEELKAEIRLGEGVRDAAIGDRQTKIEQALEQHGRRLSSLETKAHKAIGGLTVLVTLFELARTYWHH